MRTVDKEIGGIVWRLREMTVREQLNVGGKFTEGGFGDGTIAAVVYGLEAADGVEIPKDHKSKAAWIETYFQGKVGTLTQIANEILAFSKVGDEGKEPSASLPTSSVAT